MFVKFFGVRGSYPAPNKDMLRYGGRTSCVGFFKEVEGKTIPLYIDAGLGIIEAGKEILPRVFNGTANNEFTILFTHLHPDHTEGFTFFAPNFIPSIKLHLLGPTSLKKNVGMVLRDKMAPPTYPIEYKDLKSERIHGIVSDGLTFYINKRGVPVGIKNTHNYPKKSEKNTSDDFVFEIKAMQSFAPSHPQQGSIYYRVTDWESKKSVACIWDIESRIGGDQRVISFSKDADVMIHDTHYTEDEYNSDKMIVQGFGHSTYSMAVENAQKANVKTIIGFHYNPTHTDAQLEENAKGLSTDKLKFILSHEGLELKL